MKRIRLGLGLVMLVQLACYEEEFSPEYFCEMRGGTLYNTTGLNFRLHANNAQRR